MAWSGEYSIRSLSPSVAPERSLVEKFLQRENLRYERDIEYTVGVFQADTLVATGSIAGRVIKGVAVKRGVRGENLTAKIVSYLKLNAYHNGVNSLFVFTTPENRSIFASLGFSLVVETNEAVLFEDNKHSFRRYCAQLEAIRREDGTTAALVMNCNPFTNGHRYLVESAAAQSDNVVIFVVQEDRSVFSFDDRLHLVTEGTKDLPNVTVVPGGDYIISNATFPTYFIKDTQRIDATYAELDVTLFGRSIAPAIGATCRFVGHEPYCPVTAHYNRTLKTLLPAAGIEVVEVERKEAGGRAISASEVRRLWAEGALDAVAQMVPDSTYRFLLSDTAQAIKGRLQGGEDEDR